MMKCAKDITGSDKPRKLAPEMRNKVNFTRIYCIIVVDFGLNGLSFRFSSAQTISCLRCRYGIRSNVLECIIPPD